MPNDRSLHPVSGRRTDTEMVAAARTDPDHFWLTEAKTLDGVNPPTAAAD